MYLGREKSKKDNPDNSAQRVSKAEACKIISEDCAKHIVEKAKRMRLEGVSPLISTPGFAVIVWDDKGPAAARAHVRSSTSEF
jgi:hypothetical protein